MSRAIWLYPCVSSPVMLKNNLLGRCLSTLLTTESLLWNIICLSGPPYLAWVSSHSGHIVIGITLYLVDNPLLLSTKGAFLCRPVIPQLALRTVAFLYPENIPLKLSVSFFLEGALVAEDLNHITHRNRVPHQASNFCKSYLAPQEAKPLEALT